MPLGIWRGCDQVQIVYVLYWNLNIAAVFRACRQFQYPLISFNVKSEENTINLINRTKKRLLCELERFLVTTGMRRYVLNETKSFFSMLSGFSLFHINSAFNRTYRRTYRNLGIATSCIPYCLSRPFPIRCIGLNWYELLFDYSVFLISSAVRLWVACRYVRVFWWAFVARKVKGEGKDCIRANCGPPGWSLSRFL